MLLHLCGNAAECNQCSFDLALAALANSSVQYHCMPRVQDSSCFKYNFLPALHETH